VSNYNVAVIGGDGIGPEVVTEALKAIAASGVKLNTIDYELGAATTYGRRRCFPIRFSKRYRKPMRSCLARSVQRLDHERSPLGHSNVACFFGSGFELDLYVNLRPFNGVTGAIAPHADFVVIRENTEGSYAGEGGQLRKGTQHEVATQGSVNTYFGVERCVRFAFELAQSRPRQLLTMVHKNKRSYLCRGTLAARNRRGGHRVPVDLG